MLAGDEERRYKLSESICGLEGENMSEPFRRIVTGHDSQGRAVIQSVGPPERVVDISAQGPRFYEVWNTQATPAPIDRNSAEPHEAQLTLIPPKGGTRIRVLDIAPETAESLKMDSVQVRQHFEKMAAGDAPAGSRHPYMHRTETIDYGIVLDGEIWLVMDEGEVLCKQGDIIVQRGTNHAWANRSGRNCRIAFVLIDGQFVDGLS
jgi:hypothetical protein